MAVVVVVVVVLAVVRPAAAKDPRVEDARLAQGVRTVIEDYVKKAAGASEWQELVAAMAAVVGERCQEAAAEFPVRKHMFVPGQWIFSDKVNVLLAGDGSTMDLKAIPASTVYGQIRDQVAGGSFRDDRFPDLTATFREFPNRIGRPEDWGKVPLSLPPKEWPRLLPLRVAFDTRKGVDAVLKPIRDDKERALRVCTLALTLILKDVDEHVLPAISLPLAFETINGMAKTAPMLKAIAAPTEEMKAAQHKVIKVGRR